MTEPFPTSFSLISRDGHKFNVDPLVLAGTSKVFADMLRSGTGAEKSCEVSEKTEDVEMYLEAIEEGVKSNIDVEAWYTLLKMADKYDSKALHAALKLVFNPATRRTYAADAAAYSCAVLCGDATLAEKTALDALKDLKIWKTAALWNKLPQLDRFRLENYGHRYLQAQRDLLLGVNPKHCTAHTARAKASAKFVQQQWDKARIHTLNNLSFDLTPQYDLEKQVKKGLHDGPDCQECVDNLNAALAKVEKEWETGKKGKDSVKLF